MTVTLYVEMSALEDFDDFLATLDPSHLPFLRSTLKEYVAFVRPKNTSLTWVQVNLDKQEWAKVYNHLLD